MPERFIDSNVVLYSIAHDQPKKRSVAIPLVADSLRDNSGIVSTQVIQECLSVVTRRSLMTGGQAQVWLKLLMPMCAVFPSEGLYGRALGLHERYGFSFYDATIVAAALVAGCSTLETEDLQHGQVIESLTINNPFV